jgi:hypothetical protein
LIADIVVQLAKRFSAFREIESSFFEPVFPDMILFHLLRVSVKRIGRCTPVGCTCVPDVLMEFNDYFLHIQMYYYKTNCSEDIRKYFTLYFGKCSS